MDIYFKYMDNIFMHVAPLPRRFPACPQVQSVGYTPNKSDHVTNVFSSINFSLLLRGEGTYEWQGRLHVVQAPCVITQWPGVRMDYGPRSGTTWEELYIIYERDAIDAFQASHLLSFDQPFWLIRRETRVLEAFEALCELLQASQMDGYVDRVDRGCESLLLETHLGARYRNTPSREEEVVHAIRRTIRENPFMPYDLTALAYDYGLSPSTFRRYWKQFVPEPPGRYLTHVRMRGACRMLVETDCSIAEVARETGYEDPFYFSRAFRQIMGMAPRAYRKRHLVARVASTFAS